MKMTILKARTNRTAATLAFCLFFLDTVEAAVEKGKDCSLEPCNEELYCVEQSSVVPMFGIVLGSYKRCVECMSDYDCPASISCNDPLTPIAMCDWGAQKTFPGIDNIRKGYNGYKSDPLMYKSNSDPGFETEGFLFKWDYMEEGTSTFTFNNELYDVPKGYFVNVEESCSLAMNTHIIDTEVDFSISMEESVTKTKGEEGEGPTSSVGTSAKASFSEAHASSQKTVSTKATCVQYVIEVNKFELNSISLDDHLKDFIETTGSADVTEMFDYSGLFDRKGTHYVAKAWIGSKFGITQTITTDSMKTVSGGEESYSSQMSAEGGGFFSSEEERSSSFELRTEMETASESLNKYSIGSSNIISLEEWSAASKLNPEVVKMEVGPICKMLDSHTYEMPANFIKLKCEQEASAYTNKRICYNIEINTCTIFLSGTDSPLHLSLYGKLGAAQELEEISGIYMNDKIDGNAFENGNKETFTICDTNIGDIYKVGIRGGGDTWRPGNIAVNGKHYNYKCEKEIDNEEVQQVLTDTLMTYKIVVETADNGTDRWITIKLYGWSKGEYIVVEIPFLNNYSDHTNSFEAGNIDTCVVDGQVILDSIERIGIKTGDSWSDVWSVQKITVNGQLFTFDPNEEIDYYLEYFNQGAPDDPRKTTYAVVVTTADVSGAGTNSWVTLKLIGKLDGEDKEVEITKLNNLCGRSSANDAFEQNQVDTCAAYQDKLDIINRIAITTGNEGLGSDWHVKKITVNDQLFSFDPNVAINADRYYDNGEERMDYTVVVTTADVGGAGTDASVTLKLIGTLGGAPKEVEITNMNQYSDQGNSFERNQVDTCHGVYEEKLDIIDRIQIKTDSSYDWHVKKITVNDKLFSFDPNVAIDNGGYRENVGERIDYGVLVKTTDSYWAGTDGKITLKLIGSLHGVYKEVSIYPLNDQCTGWNSFERNQVDTCTGPGMWREKLDPINTIAVRNDAGNCWNVDWVTVNGQAFYFDGNQDVCDNHWYYSR